MKVCNKVTGVEYEALIVKGLTGEKLIQAIKSWMPSVALNTSMSAITLAGRAVEGNNVLLKRPDGVAFLLSRAEMERFYEVIVPIPADAPYPAITIPKDVLLSAEIGGIARERYYVSPDAPEAVRAVAASAQSLAVNIVHALPGGPGREATLAHLDDVLARAQRAYETRDRVVNEFPVMRSI